MRRREPIDAEDLRTARSKRANGGATDRAEAQDDRVEDQSALAPLSFAIFDHFAISDFTNAANSARESPTGTNASCVNFSLTSGEASILWISVLSLSTIAAGVFAGAASPIHPTDSNPG